MKLAQFRDNVRPGLLKVLAEAGLAIGIELEDQADCIDRWEWTGEGFAIEPAPTHWMEMPEPPGSSDEPSAPTDDG